VEQTSNYKNEIGIHVKCFSHYYNQASSILKDETGFQARFCALVYIIVFNHKLTQIA